MRAPMLLIVLAFLSTCTTIGQQPAVAQQYSPDDKVWAPASDGLRHVLSGFTCPANLDDWTFKDVTINPNSAPGLNVACHLNGSNQSVISFFLIHSTQVPPFKEHFKQTKLVMQTIGSTGVERPVPDQSDGQPVTPFAAAARATPYDGRLRLDRDLKDTVLWMDEEGFWRLYIRATYFRGDEANVADTAAQVFQKARAELPTGLMSLKREEDGPKTAVSD